MRQALGFVLDRIQRSGDGMLPLAATRSPQRSPTTSRCPVRGINVSRLRRPGQLEPLHDVRHRAADQPQVDPVRPPEPHRLYCRRDQPSAPGEWIRAASTMSVPRRVPELPGHRPRLLPEVCRRDDVEDHFSAARIATTCGLSGRTCPPRPRSGANTPEKGRHNRPPARRQRPSPRQQWRTLFDPTGQRASSHCVRAGSPSVTGGSPHGMALVMTATAPRREPPGSRRPSRTATTWESDPRMLWGPECDSRAAGLDRIYLTAANSGRRRHRSAFAYGHVMPKIA